MTLFHSRFMAPEGQFKTRQKARRGLEPACDYFE
jgi:hypothetical protein